VKESGWAIPDEIIIKPAECIDKSCLCLYKDTKLRDFGPDQTENPPLRCVPFKEDITFLGVANENTNFGMKKNVLNSQMPFDSFEYLVLYGTDVNGKKLFYIHKTAVKDKNYIFISLTRPAVSSFSVESKKKVPEVILNKVFEQFKSSLSSICDASNGLRKVSIIQGIEGFVYEPPKEGICISGSSFANDVDMFIAKEFSNRNIKLEVFKDDKQILQYDEPQATTPYSAEKSEGNIRIKLSVYY
jgi:hypothetical protein